MSEHGPPDPETLARDLFDAGKDEAPSAAGRAKAMAALGLDAPPPAGTPSGASGGGSAALKWLGGALLVGAVGAGVVLSRGDDRPREPAPPPTASAPTTPATPATTLLAPAPPPPSSAEIAPSPTTAESATSAASAKPPPAAPKPSASAPQEDALAAEIAALDRARTSLASDPSRALEELARYDAAFPRGSLKNEAVVLRVEALVKAGRRDEAARLGEAFLKTHASDLSGQRVRRLLDAP